MYLTKQDLYTCVEQYRQKLFSVGLSFPLDFFSILKVSPNITFDYADFDTPGLRGMAFVNYNGFNSHGILIKSTLSKEEQNFHGVHEILHTVLHSQITNNSFKCYDQIRPNQSSFIEWQANEGAAELIMPYRNFIPQFLDLLQCYQFNSAYWTYTYGGFDIFDVLAKHYGVTSIVAKNRVSTLSFEIDQYARGTPIDSIRVISHNRQQIIGVQATDYVYLIQMATLKYDFGLPWDGVIL